MDIQFLGTGAGQPSKARNVSSLALKLLDEINEVWLFDCGEGTQNRILETTIRPRKVSKIFITPLHGDHIVGLPGGLEGSPVKVGAVVELGLVIDLVGDDRLAVLELGVHRLEVVLVQLHVAAGGELDELWVVPVPQGAGVHSHVRLEHVELRRDLPDTEVQVAAVLQVGGGLLIDRIAELGVAVGRRGGRARIRAAASKRQRQHSDPG